jgi:hypothetical protein
MLPQARRKVYHREKMKATALRRADVDPRTL